MLLYKESECRDGLCAIYDTDDNSLELLSPAYVAECIKAGITIKDLPKEGELYDLLNPKNKNLTRAKKEKNDEFYTQLTDIEKELSHYDPEIFRDKVIYCPTDVATDQGKILQSQFVHYFQLKKDDLKFKKLIATCLAEKGEEFNNKYILVRKLSPYADPSSPYYNPNLTEDDDRYWSWGESTSECKADSSYGSGDFRSEECLQLFDEADIVITNPPFSLFREFVKVLMEHGNKFLIVGNLNSLTSKDIFSLYKDGKIWLGQSIHSGDRAFYVPESYSLEAAGCGVDADGKRFIKVKGVRWYTNLDFSQRHEFLDLLPKEHWEKQGVVYDTYDNYDAINVSKYKQIPSDYNGAMGVPISYFDFYCPEQFEILGFMTELAEPFYDEFGKRHSGAFYIDGKRIYARIIIRHKKHECKYKVGDYLTFTYNGDRRGAEVTRVDGRDYFVTLKIEGVETVVPSSELSAVRRM